ncbi:hypothetical protein B0O80DRAFT_285830 [Mortierella sp. GBAus27b]|nr:hypothetical protein B0O80DRAFT_285830 [Mortierella sp. GBAus27b]
MCKRVRGNPPSHVPIKRRIAVSLHSTSLHKRSQKYPPLFSAHLAMKVNSVVALALLGLVSQTEAVFNFGKVLRTTANTMNSASTIVNSILGVYKDDGIVCEEAQFKARVVATGAFCQLENDNGAIAACQNFGQDSSARPCAKSARALATRSCLERTSIAANMMHVSSSWVDTRDPRPSLRALRFLCPSGWCIKKISQSTFTTKRCSSSPSSTKPMYMCANLNPTFIRSRYMFPL